MSKKIKIKNDRLVKIVRDNIGENIDAHDIKYQLVDKNILVDELYKKLLEETAELLIDKNAEELADVLSLVKAISNHQFGLSLQELIKIMEEKEKKLGDFSKGYGMFTTPKTKKK